MTDNIYINDSLIDIDVTIPLTFQLFDLAKIDSKTGAVTVQLTAPITDKNKAIFGDLMNINSADKLTNDVKITARIVKNGITKVRGVAKIISSTNKGYQFYIYANNNNWIPTISTLNLQDLDLSSLDHTYNETEITARESEGDPIIYGLVNYGRIGTRANFGEQLEPLTTNAIRIEDRFPSYNIYYLLEKIYRSQGYQLSSNFLTGIKDNLYMPFTNKKFKIPQSVADTEQVDYSDSSGVNAKYTFHLDAGNTTFYDSSYNEIYVNFGTPQHKLQFVDGTNFTIKQTLTGKYKYSCKFYTNITNFNNETVKVRIDAILQNSSTSTDTYLTSVGGTNIYSQEIELDKEYNLINVDFESDIIADNEIQFYITKLTEFSTTGIYINAISNNGGYTQLTVSDTSTFKANDYIILKNDSSVDSEPNSFIVRSVDDATHLTIDLIYSSIWTWTSIENITLRIEIDNNQSCVKGTMQLDLFRDNTFVINENLPDFNQLDFIKSLAKRFNLFFNTDEERKIVYIEDFNTYFKDIDECIDWSDKIDYSKEKDFSIEQIQQPKKIIFGGAIDSKDKSVALYNEKNEVNFANVEISYSNLFSKDTKTITDSFSDTAMSTMWICPTYEFPTMVNAKPIGNISTEYNHRILYYKLIKATDLSDVDWWYFESTQKYVLPHLFSYDVTDNDNLITTYSDSKNQNGLVSTQYNNSLQIYNSGLRFKCFLNLNNQDISNLDFRKPIKLKTRKNGEAYFYLNKISQYTGYNTVECEFILKMDSQSIKVQPTSRDDQLATIELYDDNAVLGGDDNGGVVIWSGNEQIGTIGISGFVANDGNLVTEDTDGAITPVYAHDSNNQLYRVAL